jgi:hypothetical protein
VLGTALTLLLATGCGAGKNAPTSTEVPAIQGVDADAGPIALRNLLIPYQAGGYPAGSDVPLVVRMYNSDHLQPVQVSEVSPGAAGPMIVQAQQFVVRQSGPTAGGDGGSPTSLVVPPDGDLLLVQGSGPYLVATNITAALPYTSTLAVRFTFSTNDSVEVDVPMAPPDYPVTGPQSTPPTSHSVPAG